ncbi:MAG: hypothetical protein ACOCP8_06530 [archaeon]
MANYLSNENLVPELIYYKETGIATEEFGEQLLLLARNIASKGSFSGYT